MFQGVYTAIVTPFKNGKVDYDSLAKIIEHQINSGVSGLVPMGTTGESPAVSHEEHHEVVKKTVDFAAGRVKVIAGAGSNSTIEAVTLSQQAEKSGADALLQVNPYYNKPTQNGLIAHFEAVAKSVSIPVILYNIPGRTGVNFLPESVDTLLQKVSNVKAMKEASGDLSQMMRLIELCGDRIDILSGDDNLLLPLLSVGGTGVVSVLSNIVPEKMVEIVSLYSAGKIDEARKAFYKILPLCRVMFLETNPIPIKAVMARAGWCSAEIRLPLQELSADKIKMLDQVFDECGVKTW